MQTPDTNNALHSPEWKAWIEQDGKEMNPAQLAEFLNERSSDLVSPSGDELLSSADQLLQLCSSALMRSEVLSTGEYRFHFQSSNKPSSVVVPPEIILGISPFDKGEAYGVKGLIHYRISSDKLLLWYQLVDTHRVIKSAFQKLIK